MSNVEMHLAESKNQATSVHTMVHRQAEVYAKARPKRAKRIIPPNSTFLASLSPWFKVAKYCLLRLQLRSDGFPQNMWRT